MLKGRLLDESTRRIHAEDEHPHVALQTFVKGDKKCRHCKKPGHFEQDCWIKHPEKRPSRIRQTQVTRNSKGYTTAFAVRTNTDTHKSDWIVDTGATQHICTDKSAMIHLRPTEMKVLTANKQVSNAAGQGEVKVVVRNDSGKQSSIHLKNVLLCPDFSSNLLSIPALDSSFSATISSKGLSLLKNGTQIAFVKKKDRQYALHSIPPDIKLASTNQVKGRSSDGSPSRSFQEWHERLGHLNLADMKRLCKMVEGLPAQVISETQELNCTSCSLSKLTNKHVPSRGEYPKAQAALNIVHVDIGGPYEPRSLGKAAYLITFTDVYSRYRKTYTMATKDETLGKVQDFVILSLQVFQ